MKDLFFFLKRYAGPYAGNIFLSVLFNFLTAFFTLFSFAFIIPILQMLFGLGTAEYSFMPWDSASLKETVVNNFYWYVSEMVRADGASFTLAMLCVTLVVMTLLKVSAGYLSEFFTIPMQNSVMASLFSIIKYPIMIVACLGMMLVISWQLTLFVFVMLPLFGFIMGSVGKKLKEKSMKAQNKWGDILSNVEETIGGLRVVKAFNAEKMMERRFGAQTEDLYRINNSVLRRTTMAHPMSEFLGTTAVAVILWFGGSLILTDRSSIDAASFIYYMVMFYSIINPAKEISKVSYLIRKGMAAKERIDKILGADNPIHDPERPVPLPAGIEKSEVAFRDVTFSYDGERDVLRDINLTVRPGETVAIVGQSGSGKSTLVDLIPRFWDVEKGSITVDGIDVKDLRVKELRALMGNVSQEAILFNDTIFNNIAFGSADATPERVEEAARVANAHDFIMDTPGGYDTVIGDRGCRLSGGQRQRISIARAILKDPAILILDEATSALDTESERLVQEALEKLMRGRTTIVIAHRLSTITNADRICVLKEGAIVEEGTHDQLIARGGLYRHLVDMQQV